MDESRRSEGAVVADGLVVERALQMPVASIRYSLGRALTEHARSRGRECIAVDDRVDFVDLAAEGFCSVAPAPDVHSEVLTEWRRRGEVGRSFGAGSWLLGREGRVFEAIQATWNEGWDHRNGLWIIGDDDAETRAFVAALLEANNVPSRAILVFAKSCFSSDRALFRAAHSAEWRELILPGDLAERARNEVVSFLAAKPLYEKYAIPYKRGILLSGPPGNGKTHCVRLLIKEAALPTLYVKSFAARYGEEEANIASVFARARMLAPCLLVLEDVDSLVRPNCLSVFLNELDGLRADTGILTVATTNHPERLDPALLERPSRFDRKYHFGLPAAPERARYLALWNEKLEPDLRLDPRSISSLVDRTNKASFAFLKELLLSATMRWVAEERRRPMGKIALEELKALRKTWRPIDEGDVAATEKKEEDE